MRELPISGPMKYEKTLYTAQVSLRILWLLGLVMTGTFLVFIIATQIGAFFLKGAQSPEAKQLGGLFHSFDLLATYIGVCISTVLLSMVFRNLALVMGFLRHQRDNQPEIISRLKQTTKLLVAAFVVDSVLCISNVYELLKNPPKESEQQVYELVVSVMTYLVPSFPGTSALVFALLIYLLAVFLEDKVNLQREVGALKEETSLTI